MCAKCVFVVASKYITIEYIYHDYIVLFLFARSYVLYEFFTAIHCYTFHVQDEKYLYVKKKKFRGKLLSNNLFQKHLILSHDCKT